MVAVEQLLQDQLRAAPVRSYVYLWITPPCAAIRSAHSHAMLGSMAGPLPMPRRDWFA